MKKKAVRSTEICLEIEFLYEIGVSFVSIWFICVQ